MDQQQLTLLFRPGRWAVVRLIPLSCCSDLVYISLASRGVLQSFSAISSIAPRFSFLNNNISNDKTVVFNNHLLDEEVM
jgi:hypothetical protein